MTGSGPSVTTALASAEAIRDQLIGLTYQLPENMPRRVMAAWNSADVTLRDFILTLQELER